MKRFVDELIEYIDTQSITISVNDGGKLARSLAQKSHHINVIEKEYYHQAINMLQTARNVSLIENDFAKCWKTVVQNTIICKPTLNLCKGSSNNEPTCEIDTDILCNAMISGHNILDIVDILECKNFCFLVPFNYKYDDLINKYPLTTIIRYFVPGLFCVIIKK
jgi:hypothetical protein